MIKSGANKSDQEKITKMANGEYDEDSTKFSAKEIASFLQLSESCVKGFMPKKSKKG